MTVSASDGVPGCRWMGLAWLVCPLAIASLLFIGCGPGRPGGPRPEPIPEEILDRIDEGAVLPTTTTRSPPVDDPSLMRVPLGDDKNPWVTVGQSALMVGLFAAAAAICGEGNCRLR